MVWYTGTVTDAVKICKQRAGLLCIFVRDGSILSEKLDGFFTERDVVDEVSQPDILLLRIQTGTADYDMLNSVYPVTSVPMIQFIDGANGRLLFSVKPTTKDEVFAGVREGIETWSRQRSVPPTEPMPGTSTTQVPPPRFVTSESTATTSSAAVASDEESLDIRIRRAQEKAAEIRRKKDREAEQAARDKEAHLRNEQRLMAQAERQRMENQAEELRKEMDKTRKDDEAHRQKVLKQLREDREERERQQAAAKATTSTTSTVVRNNVPEASSSTQSIDYTKSRIQFRYESGEGMRTFIGNFEATDPLGAAFDFAKKETGLKGNITFLQMYPRKDFTMGDAKTTLRLLGLVPNAVLMVLSGDGGRAPSQGSSGGFLQNLMNNVWYIIQLPMQGVTFILRYLFPTTPAIQNPTSTSTAGGTIPRRQTDERGAGAAANRDNFRQRRPVPPPDATYNGNSTQQL